MFLPNSGFKGKEDTKYCINSGTKVNVDPHAINFSDNKCSESNTIIENQNSNFSGIIIGGFVTSIVSLVFYFLSLGILSFELGIIAASLSIIGIFQNDKGIGFAIAGTAISVCSLLLFLASFL